MARHVARACSWSTAFGYGQPDAGKRRSPILGVDRSEGLPSSLEDDGERAREHDGEPARGGRPGAKLSPRVPPSPQLLNLGPISGSLGLGCVEDLGASTGARPPPPGGPLGVCTGPNSQFYKRKNPNRKAAYIFRLSLSNLEGRLPRKPAHRSLALLPLNYGKKGYQKKC